MTRCTRCTYQKWYHQQWKEWSQLLLNKTVVCEYCSPNLCHCVHTCTSTTHFSNGQAMNMRYPPPLDHTLNMWNTVHVLHSSTLHHFWFEMPDLRMQWHSISIPQTISSTHLDLEVQGWVPHHQTWWDIDVSPPGGNSSPARHTTCLLSFQVLN